ncbi:MAG TPA: hypothetical protein DGT21_09430 [Armatimonadetes bacterium]|jgi:hypothetical protein|nr:hypothetical protein [Armatimonadota bacterium]
MRTILGVIIGMLLFFPGILVLQAVSNRLGFYDDMSLTDGCLVVIIILLTVHLLRGGWSTGEQHQEPEGRLAGSSSRRNEPRRPHGQTRP